MSEEDLQNEARLMTRWQRHKFMVLVVGTIAIALVLVSISLHLYSASGAMQLDLSRPGYQSIRDQANQSDDFKSFSSSGAIDKEALDEFRALYDEQLKEATAVESFGGDVMSDSALGLSLPAQ